MKWFNSSALKRNNKKGTKIEVTSGSNNTKTSDIKPSAVNENVAFSSSKASFHRHVPITTQTAAITTTNKAYGLIGSSNVIMSPNLIRNSDIRKSENILRRSNRSYVSRENLSPSRFGSRDALQSNSKFSGRSGFQGPSGRFSNSVPRYMPLRDHVSNKMYGSVDDLSRLGRNKLHHNRDSLGRPLLYNNRNESEDYMKKQRRYGSHDNLSSMCETNIYGSRDDVSNVRRQRKLAAAKHRYIGNSKGDLLTKRKYSSYENLSNICGKKDIYGSHDDVSKVQRPGKLVEKHKHSKEESSNVIKISDEGKRRKTSR